MPLSILPILTQNTLHAQCVLEWRYANPWTDVESRNSSKKTVNIANHKVCFSNESIDASSYEECS